MGSPPSAAHTTPWPRPRPSRGLWPEARWSEGAAPPSRPCRTGTAAPELKRSDDRPHAPWFASATPGPSVYPQPQPSGIPADPFSRSPYEAHQCPSGGHRREQRTRDNHRTLYHGWESDRPILSRKSPKGRRGDGEKGAAGRDHDGAGEGPDTALATLAAEPPACE